MAVWSLKCILERNKLLPCRELFAIFNDTLSSQILKMHIFSLILKKHNLMILPNPQSAQFQFNPQKARLRKWEDKSCRLQTIYSLFSPQNQHAVFCIKCFPPIDHISQRKVWAKNVPEKFLILGCEGDLVKDHTLEQFSL